MATGAARPSAGLRYTEEWYTPANLEKLIKDSEGKKMIRAEYTRLRDIEEKRIKRIGAVPEFKKLQVYVKNAGSYPKLKDLKGKEGRIPYLLNDLSRFITAKGSTVAGIREIRAKQLETLHEHKYRFVTEENLTEFGEFMEEFRAQKLPDQGYESGDAADTYYIVEKHNLDPETVYNEFEFWLKNQGMARKLKPSVGKFTGSADQLKKRIARAKKKKKTKKATKTKRKR